MSEREGLSTWSLIKFPVAISLIVLVARLVGELQGWDQLWFSRGQPGGEEWHPGLVGVSWLMPIFGLWFGFRLRRATGGPPRLGKTLALALLGAGIMVGGIAGLNAAGMISMPDADNPAEPFGIGWVMGVFALSAVVGIAAWGRLGVAMLVYALIVRLAVVAVTYLALQNDWSDTHLVRLPAGLPPQEGMALFGYLAMPQLSFWIAATILCGAIFGSLGAALAGRRRS